MSDQRLRQPVRHRVDVMLNKEPDRKLVVAGRSISASRAGYGAMLATIVLLFAALISGPVGGLAHANGIDALTPMLYDDFSGDELDESLWILSVGTAHLEEGRVELNPTANLARISSQLALTGDKYAVRATLLKIQSGRAHVGFAFGPGAANYVRLDAASGGAVRYAYNIGGDFKEEIILPAQSINPNAPNDLLVQRDGDTFRFYVNGNLVREVTYPGFQTENIRLFLQTANAGASSHWDDVWFGVVRNIDGEASELHVEPTTVAADGASSATLTITVKDEDGEPVTGISEGEFQFSGLASATISDFDEIDDGVYTFSVTNSTAETVTISVTVGGVPLGSFAPIDFVQGPSAGESQLSVEPTSVIANGVSSATLRIELNDAGGERISGLTESEFVFSDEQSATISDFDEVEDGVYTFSVANTAVETVTISVKVRGIDLGAFDPIEFTAQVPDVGESDLSVDTTSVIANGVSSAMLTIQVKDADGQPITGLTESDFHFENEENADIEYVSASSGGVYTFSVTNTAAETVTINVKVGDVELGSFAAINFIAQEPNADESDLSVIPTTVSADGVSSATLTITVKDADGQPIAGLAEGAFVFGGQANAAIGGFNEAGVGVYTFSVTNTAAETVTISVTVSGIDLGAFDPIEFTAQVPDVGKSNLSVAPTTVSADGTSSATLTITVKDEDGEPITGLSDTAFVFSDEQSATIGSFAEVGGGVYTFSVTNTTSQTVTISVTVAGVEFGTFDPITFEESWAVSLAAPDAVGATAGAVAVIEFEVENTGSNPDDYAILVVGEKFSWEVYSLSDEVVSDTGIVAPGATVSLEARALVPMETLDGATDTVQLSVTSKTDAAIADATEIEVAVQVPVLLITVETDTLDTDVKPNDIIEYRISLQNTGSATALGVQVYGPVPESTHYVAGSASLDGVSEANLDNVLFDAAGGLLTLGSIGTPVEIEPDETVAFAYRVRVVETARAGTTITNRVRTTYRNAASVVYQELGEPVTAKVAAVYGVEVDGASARTVHPGGQVQFPFVVTNTGNTLDTFLVDLAAAPGAAMDGITVKWYADNDNDGRVSAGDSPLIATAGGESVDTGPIQAGDARAVIASLTLDPGVALGSYGLEATFTSWRDPQGTAERTIPLDLHVANAAATVRVQEVPTSVYAGTPYLLKIEYASQGNVALQDVVIEAPLASEVSVDPAFDLAQAGGTYDLVSRTVRWEIDALAPGESGTVEVGLVVDATLAAATSIDHVAKITATGVPAVSAVRRTHVVAKNPTSIRIAANPRAVVGDGASTSTLTVTLLDALGNPVSDETDVTVSVITVPGAGTVRFILEDGGTPVDGPVTLQTENGVATAQLLAPEIAGSEPIRAVVIAEAANPAGTVRQQIDILYSPGAIVGRLVDSTTGRPESGVLVQLLDEDGNERSTAITDEGGFYHLVPPGQGVYTVKVIRASGGGDIEESVQVEVVTNSITPGPQIVQGRLVQFDEATQAMVGIANTTVVLRDSDGTILGQATTDADGYYRIVVQGSSGIGPVSVGIGPMAAYGITPMQAGGDEWVLEADLPGGGVAAMGITPPGPGDMVIGVLMVAEPTGTVKHALTGNPVQGASVGLHEVAVDGDGVEHLGALAALPLDGGLSQPNPKTTAADGGFRFRVEPGRYMIVVDAPGFHQYVSAPILVDDDALIADIELLPLSDQRFELSVTADPVYVSSGGTVLFRIEAANASTQVVSNVKIVQYLPADVTPTVPLPLGGVYDAGTQSIEWSIPSLAAGEAATLVVEAALGVFPSEAELETEVYMYADDHAGDPLAASAKANFYVGNWPAIEIDKSADRSHASVGEIVRYRIVVENLDAAIDLIDAVVEDAPPHGFVFLEGSGRVDVGGTALASDPTTFDGVLTWNVGDIAAGERVEITYAMALSAASGASDGVNVARAAGLVDGVRFETGPAHAKVTVETGLFGSSGTIVGRVFVDSNGNNVPDVGEQGVAKARLITDEGIAVVTDDDGYFSLKGVAAGVHALKLDAPVVSSAQFVRVPVGGLAVANFAVLGDEPSAGQRQGGFVVLSSSLTIPTQGENHGHLAFYNRRELDSGVEFVLRYSTRDQSMEEPTLARLLAKEAVMGDASRSFDLAPSADPLYLKLGTDRTYVQYGDFRAPSDNNRYTFNPGRMTGLFGQVEGDGPWSLSAYTSALKWAEHEEELDPQGFTGPRYLERAPVIVGSEDVWLKQVTNDDEQAVLSRALLRRDVDYTIDYETGAIMFTNPIPNWDGAFVRNVIEVTYRTSALAFGTIGGLGDSGARLAYEPETGRSWGVTAVDSRGEGERTVDLGVDGVFGVDLGDRAEVGVNVAGRFAGDKPVQIGTAARLELVMNWAERWQSEFVTEYVSGAYAEDPDADERSWRIAVDHELASNLDLQYVHGYAMTAGEAPEHEDVFRLRVRTQPNLIHTLEVRSFGEGALPLDATRTAQVQAKSAWSLQRSPSERLSVTGGIAWTSSKEDGAIALPLQAGYERSLGAGTSLGAGYETKDVLGEHAEWVVTLQSQVADGANVYGRHRVPLADGDESQTQIGVRYRWEALKDVAVSAAAERTLPSATDQGATSVSAAATYSGFDGHLATVRFSQRWTDDEPQRSILLAAEGSLLAGVDYRLSGAWHEVPEIVSDRRLLQELKGSLAYRDRGVGAHTLLGQFLQRTYREPGLIGAQIEERQVGIAALDWAYQFSDQLTFTAKAGVRQSARSWVEGADQAQSYATSIYLLQGSVRTRVIDRVHAEVFGRQLSDSVGETLRGGAVELSYDLAENLAVVAGYGSLAIDDPDLREVASWSEGLYYRLQVKF